MAEIWSCQSTEDNHYKFMGYALLLLDVLHKYHAIQLHLCNLKVAVASTQTLR